MYQNVQYILIIVLYSVTLQLSPSVDCCVICHLLHHCFNEFINGALHAVTLLIRIQANDST